MLAISGGVALSLALPSRSGLFHSCNGFFALFVSSSLGVVQMLGGLSGCPDLLRTYLMDFVSVDFARAKPIADSSGQ
jgi:hypothetical protein